MKEDYGLWEAFSRYIRLRDASPFSGIIICITCGRPLFWKDSQCGHGISRRHKATKYNEQNNHAQCGVCNAFEGGAQAEYAKQVDRRYGIGTWDKLVIISRQIVKRGRFEMETMRDEYKRLGDELKTLKNL